MLLLNGASGQEVLSLLNTCSWSVGPVGNMAPHFKTHASGQWGQWATGPLIAQHMLLIIGPVGNRCPHCKTHMFLVSGAMQWVTGLPYCPSHAPVAQPSAPSYVNIIYQAPFIKLFACLVIYLSNTHCQCVYLKII